MPRTRPWGGGIHASGRGTGVKGQSDKTKGLETERAQKGPVTFHSGLYKEKTGQAAFISQRHSGEQERLNSPPLGVLGGIDPGRPVDWCEGGIAAPSFPNSLSWALLWESHPWPGTLKTGPN